MHFDQQHLIGVELGSHLKCCGDLELVDEVKRNHYHRVAAEKNEVQKQLQTSQISDKYESMQRSQMQAICLLDRDTVHKSTEDGWGQGLDLCFNLVIQLLVVFMLPYHHHQTASLHAHGSSQVLPEDGRLESSCVTQAAKAK